MKKAIMSVISILIFLSFVPVLNSQQSYTIRFEKNDLSFSKIDTFDIIKIKGCISAGDIGTPLLPQKRVEILVPKDKQFSNIQVLCKTIVPIQGSFMIFPEQNPRKLNTKATEEKLIIDGNVYRSSTCFPQNPVTFAEEEKVFGNRLIALNVNPLVYFPKKRKLFLIKEITFRLGLCHTSKIPIQPMRKNAAGNFFVTSIIRKRIFNKEELRSNILKPEIVSYNGRNPDEIIQKPSYENLPRDFIIITDSTLQKSFQDLASYKRKKGIVSSVVTTQWIRDNYSGRDLAERIRNYIKDAFVYWGTTWILLGGDLSMVVTRFSNFSSWEFKGKIPTDLYFSDLDGNWDADGDGMFAEYVNGCNIDSVEGNPDILVGRIPVETEEEVMEYMDRVYRYEFNPDTSYAQKLLFLGASISGGGKDGWGALLSNDIINSYIPSNIHSYKLYAPKIDSLQNPPRWIGDEELTSFNSVININNGFNVINHIDHGAIDAIGTGVMSGGGYLHWYDADDLTNYTKPSIIWSISCSSNAFDMNSISEHFVNSPGGLAFIGNSRTGWTSQAFQDCAFFQSVYSNNITNLGAAFATTLYNSLYYRISMNLLGDPSIFIWTKPPEKLTVSHRKTITVPVDSVNFLITKCDVPVSGARVVIAKNDEQIQRIAVTDDNGKATIYLSCSEPGVMNLSVFHPNSLPYFESISVNICPLPYLTTVLNSTAFRPGTKRRIKILARNTGQATAQKVLAKLSSTDSRITIKDTILKFGNILPGKQVLSNYFTVKVSNQCPSGTKIKLNCKLFDIENHIWNDSLFVYTVHDSLCYVGHAPILYYPQKPLNSNLKVVKVPAIKILNYGDLTSYHIRVTLRSLDTLVTMRDSIVLIDSIPANMEVYSTNGFLFESSGEPDGLFAITIEDLWHTFTKTIEFSAPAEVESLGTSPGKNSIIVSWKRSTDNDLLGYFLHKRENDNWIKVTGNPITYSNYEDFDIIKGKTYTYCVTSVDSSQNESILSDSIMSASNPPLLTGWPAYIGPGGYSVHSNRCFYDKSSPAVGDIDGDGNNEIIIASNDNRIYAYNKDGSYVKGWPIDIGYRLENSPAVCDLNNDGKDEIIVGGGILDSVTLYIFNGDGSSFKPGIWPKTDCSYPLTSPIIEDIDNDGHYEIGIGCSNNKVYFWKLDGAILPGWPVSVNSPVCIAAADLNGNSQAKIVISGSGGTINIFNEDGTIMNGWPQTPGGSILSGAALADIDADGKTEIIVGTSLKKIFAFHPDGTLEQGWPITVAERISCTPAIGDMDGDGNLEIAVTTRANQVYVFKSSGQMSFDNDLGHLVNNYYVSPILVDVNNDGKKDLIVNTVEGYLYAFDYEGKKVTGFPIFYGDGSYSSPAVSDINNNGYLNLIQKGSDRRIYVWEIKNSRSVITEKWFKNGANNRNTCFYASETRDRISETFNREKGISKIHFSKPFPNPFHGNITFKISIPEYEINKHINLKIFDVSGRLIQTLINSKLQPGVNEIKWKGKTYHNCDAPSGIYFVKLKVASKSVSEIFTRKITKISIKKTRL